MMMEYKMVELKMDLINTAIIAAYMMVFKLSKKKILSIFIFFVK